MDLTMALMRATFKLDQRQDDGTTTIGTGWLVRVPEPDGVGNSDRIALVTARHVLDRMKLAQASIHWRRVDADGRWHREPAPIIIRDAGGAPLWHAHPERDIAALLLDPPAHAQGWAIGFDELADDEALKSYEVQPGDEMLALGYPRGLSANEIGFPILRAGRVASYPLWPSADFPTFLMDFAVFAGNSGGPVYMSDRARRRVGSQEFHEAQFVAGLLAQQVVLTDERLEIGIVLHAAFIRQCLLGLEAKLSH